MISNKIVFCFFLFLLLIQCHNVPKENKALCSVSQSEILVQASKHQMYLCENSKVIATYNVRLPAKGLGKQKAGDKKLPLGIYKLGHPRKSEKFGIFIPIGYPTQAQQQLGYTGDNIGIHGPGRWVRFLGEIINWFDTTSGCVGIATDVQMNAIAEWVKKNKTNTVRLEP